MEDNVETVKLEKYPETPLPREMIDMEVHNFEWAKERERTGCALRCLCNMLNTGKSSKLRLVQLSLPMEVLP